jgi:hypothetical protein
MQNIKFLSIILRIMYNKVFIFKGVKKNQELSLIYRRGQFQTIHN